MDARGIVVVAASNKSLQCFSVSKPGATLLWTSNTQHAASALSFSRNGKGIVTAVGSAAQVYVSDNGTTTTNVLPTKDGSAYSFVKFSGGESKLALLARSNSLTLEIHEVGALSVRRGPVSVGRCPRRNLAGHPHVCFAGMLLLDAQESPEQDLPPVATLGGHDSPLINCVVTNAFSLAAASR